MSKKSKKSQREKTEITQSSRHLVDLGIQDLKSYKKWCSDNGFQTSLNKNYYQLRDEVLHVKRIKADLVLSKNKPKRNKTAIFEWIENFRDKSSIKNLPQLATKYKLLEKVLISASEKSVGATHCLTTTKRLIKHLYSCMDDDLFEKVINNDTFIESLPNIALKLNSFIRTVEDWKPKSHNSNKCYGSFLRHLFATYEVPMFLDKYWFDLVDRNFPNGMSLCRNWFIYLGTGQNFRHAPDLPLSLTKKQAHHFCKAPADYTIMGAIRYAQTMSFGGNKRLVDSFFPTRLMQYSSLQHEDFWQSVIRWFIENPMLDLVHVGPIIDWLVNQKFEVERFRDINGNITINKPPQPNLSMKKRDAMATLRAVEKWHGEIGRDSKRDNSLKWESCGLPEYKISTGSKENPKRWIIRELLSSKELLTEGRAMRHCVGSYSRSCFNGSNSIWSMTSSDSSGIKNEVTIQVSNLTKEIVQVRGRFNAKMNPSQQNILYLWTRASGLSVSKYLT